MTTPNLELLNIGSDLSPKYRLAVDGILAAAHTSESALYPLLIELSESPAKAIAIRDAAIEIADRYGKLDEVIVTR